MVDQLYIVVPAYNEAANIENLVKDWYPVVEQHDGGGASRLVVVNDGSKVVRRYFSAIAMLSGMERILSFRPIRMARPIRTNLRHSGINGMSMTHSSGTARCVVTGSRGRSSRKRSAGF